MASSTSTVTSLAENVHLYCTEGGSHMTSGHVNATHIDAAVAAGHEFKSYISLLPTFTEEQCPKTRIEAAGATFRHIPMDVPAHLTTDKAMELHAELKALPKPVWIQCASANRASAALLVHLALTNGWGPKEALDYARTNGYKFVANEVLRNWVTRTLLPPSGTDLAGAQKNDVIFRQLFEPVSSTYTYILGDPVTHEAIIIDPVLEKVDRDVQILTELGLKLKYALNTHVHADHVSGTHALKTKLPGAKSVVAEVSHAVADLHINEGDVITFGGRHVRVLATPGHTDGCLTYVLDDNTMAFTGDALLIRGCGRTDFQQGNSERLYDNIHGKIFSLPESCVIYPGHDYNGNQRSTVAEEVRYNPRLNKSKDEFVAIMAGLNLARPRLIDIAVPANMKDGVVEPTPAADAPAAAPATAPGAAATK